MSSGFHKPPVHHQPSSFGLTDEEPARHANRHPTADPAAAPGRFRSILKYVALTPTALSREPPSDWFLLVLSFAAALAGLTACALLPKVYYKENTSRNLWVATWASSAGWPIPVLLLLPAYAFDKSPPSRLLSLNHLPCHAALGLLTAVANGVFIGAFSLAPESIDLSYTSFHGTSTALFAALLGCWLAGNRLRPAGVTAVFIVTAAALTVAFERNRRRPDENPAVRYLLGFVMLDAPVSLLRALALAVSERVLARAAAPQGHRRRSRRSSSLRGALELQAAASFFCFAFSCVGWAFVRRGWGQVREYARNFPDGEGAYYWVLAGMAVAFQLAVVGSTALAWLCSTAFAGVVGSARLPLSAIFAAVFFHDPMTGFKGLALVMAIWAILFYGSVAANNDGEEE